MGKTILRFVHAAVDRVTRDNSFGALQGVIRINHAALQAEADDEGGHTSRGVVCFRTMQSRTYMTNRKCQEHTSPMLPWVILIEVRCCGA